MKLLDLLAYTRLQSGDYTTSQIQVAAWLDLASRAVFEDIGGIENGEVRNALRETVSDVVSETRATVVIPFDPADTPQAVFNGKVCHLISQTAALTIDENTRLKPAFTLDGRAVTFHFDKPYIAPTSARKSSWPVSVFYTRSPKPLLYLGGYQGRLTDLSFGIPGKANLKALEITWPEARSSFDENDLVGAFVSLQTSENERVDYQIEYHEAGVLSKLFVSPNGNTVPYYDPFFNPEVAKHGCRATIHRSSELPDKYHVRIAELAVQMMMQKDKPKGVSA